MALMASAVRSAEPRPAVSPRTVRRAAVVILLGIGLVVAAVAFLVRLTGEPPVKAPVQNGSPGAGGERAEFAQAQLAAARLVLEKFLAAPSLEERKLWMADVGPTPDDWTPALAAMGGAGLSDRRPDFAAMRRLEADARTMVLVPCQGPGKDRRVVALLESEKGFRIDPSSLLTLEPMPWDRFLAERPLDPQPFRLLASALPPPEGSGADASRWRSWRLERPDGGGGLWGAARRGSALADEIDRWLAGATARAGDFWIAFDAEAVPRDWVVIRDLRPDRWTF
jgi:hypothetical protein